VYIKNLLTGEVRQYGIDRHDSLRISDDGRALYYEHLQCGEDSQYGDYRFITDKEGMIPGEDEVLIKHGADAYFNIGGFIPATKEEKRCEACTNLNKYTGCIKHIECQREHLKYFEPKQTATKEGAE